MTIALTLDFEIHTRENNPISEAFLLEHKKKFAKDCFNFFCELIHGKRLSYKQVLNDGISGDLRARIKDLRTIMGIPISDEWITTPNQRKYKEYYMTTEDKVKALEILVNKFKTA